MAMPKSINGSESAQAYPIVTVQTSKFFSVTKNSNIAPSSHACMPILPIEMCSKNSNTENFDGCTSCMPSSPKEYISPCCTGGHHVKHIFKTEPAHDKPIIQHPAPGPFV